ncbi:MAG: TMEM165/GDT1 family protein [Sphingomonadaceae bacterium]|nr:TMEM165/GDT1 family protein [Sphingomonadaceae bacterium]
MESLVTAFVAAFLCGWGDRTQLLAANLAAGTRRPGQILAGLVLAVLVSNVAAALAGAWLAPSITLRAMTLLTALALLFAGISGLIPRRQKPEAPPRWPLVATFILCLAAEMGDRVQFLVFAIAGRFGNVPLAVAGATVGLVAACVPAAMLGDRLTTTVPVRGIRWAVAAIMLIAGFITGVKALQLA